MLDRMTRSRPPTVRLLSPRRGLHLRGTGRLLVRWRAADPDTAALRATVDYAADGKTFRTVFQGPNTGHAAIPGRFVSSGTRARVRIVIDDSFSRASDISAPFRADGIPPTPQIIVPDAQAVLQAGRTVLRGSAQDDRGSPLRGRHLTWFAGSGRLGTGEHVYATLTPGRIVLRLQARDAAGRIAVAVRRITVTPVALRVQFLSAPGKVGARAKVVNIRLATTVPGTVHSGHRNTPTSGRVRTIPNPLPGRPQRGIVKATLTITAAGPRQPPVRLTIVVLRGS
jgi:hypothetical protein